MFLIPSIGMTILIFSKPFTSLLVFHFSQRKFLEGVSSDYADNIAIAGCTFAFFIAAWIFYILQAYLFIRFRGNLFIIVYFQEWRIYKKFFSMKSEEPKEITELDKGENDTKSNDIELKKSQKITEETQTNGEDDHGDDESEEEKVEEEEKEEEEENNAKSRSSLKKSGELAKSTELKKSVTLKESNDLKVSQDQNKNSLNKSQKQSTRDLNKSKKQSTRDLNKSQKATDLDKSQQQNVDEDGDDAALKSQKSSRSLNKSQKQSTRDLSKSQKQSTRDLNKSQQTDLSKSSKELKVSQTIPDDSPSIYIFYPIN